MRETGEQALALQNWVQWVAETLIQGAKPVRSTSSGGTTLRSASGIAWGPGNRNLRNSSLGENMKFTWMKWSTLPAALLMIGGVAMAQDQPAPSQQPAPQAQSGSRTPAANPAPQTAPAEKPKPTVAQRKENQQDRIAQGVKSGQLTAGETANLETKEAAINKETAADRADNS